MVAIAQLAEHLVVVQGVAGSSPVSHPSFLAHLKYTQLNKKNRSHTLWLRFFLLAYSPFAYLRFTSLGRLFRSITYFADAYSPDS